MFIIHPRADARFTEVQNDGTGTGTGLLSQRRQMYDTVCIPFGYCTGVLLAAGGGPRIGNHLRLWLRWSNVAFLICT